MRGYYMSKLINKGGFGCVYRPGITCSGDVDEDKRYVTKLQVASIDAEREILISDIIKKIENYLLYFAPVTSSCKIDVRKISKPLLKDCDIVKDAVVDYYLMRIPYVDKKSFFDFLTQNQNKVFALATLIETMKYLLSSIYKLISNNIVHFDLKGENIVYRQALYIPVIIDFGISIPIEKVTLKNLSTYFYKFAPDYYVWCLEIHFLSFLANETNVLTAETVKDVCRQFVDNNKALVALSPAFKESYYQGSIQYFGRYVDRPRAEVVGKLLGFWDTWDIYSLGILTLKLVSYMFEEGYPNNKFLMSFILTGLYNMHYDPSKRNSISDNISFIDGLYYKESNRSVLVSLLQDVSYTPTKASKLITQDIIRVPT